MTRIRRAGTGLFLVSFSVVVLLAGPSRAELGSGAVVLVTPEEAGLPDMPVPPPGFGRVPEREDRPGIGRGPRIVVISPHDGGVDRVPVMIDVRFEPTRDSQVVLATLKVEYLKLFTIDITDRVLPYASPGGIRIEKAQLPAGRHSVRISVGDQQGATSSRTLRFTLQ